MRRAFTLIELMVVVAIVGILIAITIPATSKALSRAKKIQCSGNLKQLSAAMLLYCKDNQGKFPPVQTQNYNNTNKKEQWTSLISRFISKKYSGDPNAPAKDRPVFFCPNALKHRPGTYETKHGSYGMNTSLTNNPAGGQPKRIHSHNRTSQTVMLADGHWVPNDKNWAAGLNLNDEWYPDDYPDNPTDGRSTFVHEDGANFVYLDGHTEWLPYSNYSTNEPLWTGTTNSL